MTDAVVLFGAGGFVGRNLVEALRDRVRHLVWIAKKQRAIRIGALHRLDHQMQRLRSVGARYAAKIVAFDQANQAQEAAKGTAEGGTAEQNVLLAQLHQEIVDYRTAAKIALRDRPDLQEKIGIKVHNN